MSRLWNYLLRGALAFIAFALCGVSRAEKQVAALPESLSVSTNLLSVTINLFMVLAAIVLLAWLFKRAQSFGQPAAGSMRVTATLPLGPKERILLLQVGEEHIVIGASQAGLETLHVLKEAPSESTLTDSEQFTASQPTTFRDKLLRSLRGANP